MARAWGVVIGAVILAPLVTWLPMLASRFPWLGLPPYPPAVGLDLWGLQTFWLAALGVIAVVIGQQDTWLGLAVAVVAITLFLRGATMDPTHTVMFAFGALMLHAVRQAKGDWVSAVVRDVLLCGAIFQIVYVIQQKLGYDILWGPLLGGTLVHPLQSIGTLGGVDAVSAYLAVLAPLMPFWLLPIAIYVIVASQSLGAILAATVGLVWGSVLHYGWSKVWIPLLMAVVIVAPTAYWYHYVGKETQTARLGIWQFASHEWAKSPGAMLYGYGLGGWGQRVPQQQAEAKYLPTGELWREAHNEPIQWVIETGLVGFLLLSLWLWEHSEMFKDPTSGPSLAALGSACLTWHPFHIVAAALVGVTLIGLATRPTQEESCAAS